MSSATIQSQLIRIEEDKERVEAEMGRHITQLDMLQVGAQGLIRIMAS